MARYGDGWMASAYNVTPEGFSERWGKLHHYLEELSRDPGSIGNAVVTMFIYLSGNREKARRVTRRVLAPALGRPSEDLQRLLPFGTPEQCVEKIRGLADTGVRRVFVWPI